MYHVYRGDNKRLKSQNDQMRVRLSRLLQRLQEVEDQHALHADMTVKLRERLVQMESHAQGSSQQVKTHWLDVLASQWEWGGYHGAVTLRFGTVLGRTIHKLHHFHWSLPRSADSTATKNDVIYVPS